VNLSVLLLLLALIVGAAVAWRRGARPAAVGFTAAAVLPVLTIVQTSDPFALAALIGVCAALLWHRHGRSMATVTRWGASARRKSGVASSRDIARVGSGLAMRRHAAVVRPSLRAASRWSRVVQLLSLPPMEVAVELCRVGGQRVWASIQDVVVMFGGPRTGKTQWLAGRIIDAVGAVIITSTRLDLLKQTGPLRALRGPVFVFNPVGLGLQKSTITFDPLTGCADPVTAHERAADMLDAANRASGGDREFWDEQGRRNFAALLHAAALGGLAIDVVQKWLSDLDGAESRILDLLRERSPEPAFEAAVTQFIATNPRTRTSITSTISPALGWLTHGPARAAARPISEGGRPFDVKTLLDDRAAVYMLGGEEAQVAPLVCALTGYIAREARRLAALQPGGRLDPPLSLRLDEAALICPVPLDRWSADMGGRGVSIIACFQSRAQLVDRYGQAKAAVILNNSGARVLFGGTADRDDLTYWSTLAGERDEPITTTDLHGRVASRTTHRVPVLAPSQLSNLPDRRVVVFRRGMPPVIGRAEQAWRRLDVRTVHQPDALTVRLHLALCRGRARASARLALIDGWIVARLRAGWAALARWVAIGRRWLARQWAALRMRLTGITTTPSEPPESQRPPWPTRPNVAPSSTSQATDDVSPVVVLDERRRAAGPVDGHDR
jgi:Type IV secretory pathway, VirD4 components